MLIGKSRGSGERFFRRYSGSFYVVSTTSRFLRSRCSRGLKPEFSDSSMARGMALSENAGWKPATNILDLDLGALHQRSKTSGPRDEG